MDWNANMPGNLVSNMCNGWSWLSVEHRCVGEAMIEMRSMSVLTQPNMCKKHNMGRIIIIKLIAAAEEGSLK